jgi:hypothetical protein
VKYLVTALTPYITYDSCERAFEAESAEEAIQKAKKTEAVYWEEQNPGSVEYMWDEFTYEAHTVIANKLGGSVR